MILTGFATMFIVGGPVETVSAVETNHSPPSLRIYGEENAMYPTHSVMDQGYVDAQDFIYLNAVDPFDPGVLSEDSITFNPAIIDMVYNGEEIKVDGVNSKEKVFLRTFYEPGYYHPPDLKMGATESVGDFDAVITETTYCLITHDNKPVAGAPGSTKFILPYESTDPDNPGMEHAGRVTLKDTCTGNFAGSGEIRVEKQFTDIPKNGTVNFMDHRLKFIRYEDGYNPYKAAVDISYEGNMYGAHNDSVRNYLEEGVTYYFDRNNEDYTSSHATHRWYAKINFMCDDYIDITVGRHLVGGETFYVDGVRYDMPAVHVINENDEDRFKYITFQSPLPKCETQIWYQNDPATTEDEVELNVMDWSHVSSQWLANLLPNTQGMQGYPENYVWMLPPFNEDHTMIDDIGLIKDDDERIPAGGIEIVGQKEKLEFCYIEESKEERFDTSLAERLHIEDCTYSEEWLWSSVYTKPNRYTTFILPNQETINDQYDPDTLDEYDYPYTTADGNEYLVTSSFLAPNSDPNYLRDWNTDDQWYTSPYDAHQIYDRVLNAISHEYGNDERAEFQGWPRLVFEYDAVDGTDFFVNENDDGVNNDVSLRVYGEEDYKYPTHSWSQQSYDAYGEWWQFVQNYAPWGYSSITDIGGDFIYPSHQYAFDPGAIPKDSITFNPAMIDMYYQGDRLILNGNDGREKVHLRAFYEPGFTHGPDTKMSEYYSLEPVEEFDAVVLETTYMPITVDNEPVACLPAMVEHRDPVNSMDFYPDYGQNTKFILPYKSTDANKPGMEEAGRVVLVNADSGSGDPITGFQDCDVLTDGSIVVAKKFESIPKEGDSSRSFMDHTFTFETYRMDYQDVKVKVSYDGNMYDAHSGTETQYLYEDQVYWFDRNNQKQTSSDEAHRWFVNIEFMCDDYVDVWIGRKLVAGETFYVDGVRYDMPAIAVEPAFTNGGGKQTTSVNPDSNYGFKYLTLQTPLPKCTTQMWFNDDLDDNVNDWSHVSSQWLANLLPNKQGYQGYPNNFAWVLPPFNHQHVMIDDIGLIKEDMGYSGCPDWEIPASGIRLDDEKPKLEFSYVEETTEERFITTLAERLATKCFYYPNEKWTWWNSYSNPIQYTEFILPDQETTNDPYYDQDPGLIRWEQKHNEPYPHTHADGSEYLYTSSLGAPNCEESDYWALSKYSKEAHDITDVLDKKMRDVIRQDRMGEGVEWTFGPHEDNWRIGDYSYCGEGNELTFGWWPYFDGRSYATVGPIDTTDHLYEWLTFEFVHTVDHWMSGYDAYTLGVEYSYDGSNWNTLETWTPTDDMDCQEKSYSIYVGSHNQIYLRFSFDGDSYEINWWNIDSVVLKHDNSALFYDGFESQPEVPRVSFEFDADDSTGIYLNEMNPVHTIKANDDTAETTWDNCVDINVLDNDIGDGKQVISTTEGQILSNGKIRYCASSGSGTDTDTFEYTIEDDYGQTDTATVTVTINDNPNTIEAVDDNAKTGWDECVIIDVLDNDEGQELEITSVTNPSISGATTEIVSGTIRYCVPDGSGSDTDTFDYTIEDEDENTDTATVTVHITDTAIFVQQISVPLNTCLGCGEWNRVTIDSDDAVGRVSLNITWNPDHIHVSEVQQNDMDWDYWPGFDDSTLDNGYINITAMNTKDGVTGDGIEIIRLKMSDGPQADAGQTYPVNVEWCVVKDTTIPPIELPVTVYPGSVGILGEPQYIPGDMDADGDQTQDDLDVDDLYVMARIVFDELEPLSGTDGDLDEDGDVDIDDLFILAVWVFN